MADQNEHDRPFDPFARMAARRGPSPQMVCPLADARLTWLHLVGWAVIHRAVWGGAPLNNVILCYLERRRARVLAGDLLSIAPWLFLYAVEIAAYIHAASARSFHIPLSLLAIEILILPALVGLWSQWAVIIHCGRISSRLPLEELTVTPMRPRDFLVGFALRPMLANLGAARLAGFLFFFLHIGFVAYFVSRSSMVSICDTFTILILLLYRGYVLGACVEFAGVQALRCCVFMPTRLGAIARAARDWMWPFGLMPVILPGIIVGTYFLVMRNPGTLFVAILVPPVIIWIMFGLPSIMRAKMEDAFFWMERAHRKWELYGGEK